MRAGTGSRRQAAIGIGVIAALALSLAGSLDMSPVLIDIVVVKPAVRLRRVGCAC